jgi:hypothetical protein
VAEGDEPGSLGADGGLDELNDECFGLCHGVLDC